MKTWAKELLKEGNFVVLDTEPTGLGPKDQVVSIGVLSPNDEILMDTLVRPTIFIPSEATYIHGITNDMVANAPMFAEIYPHLVELCRDKVIVVYNTDYDYRMILQTLNANGIPDINLGLSWDCAMARYAEFWGDWNDYYHSYRWQKLTAACTQQGVIVERAHRAIGDCQLTLALIKKVASNA